MVQQAGSVDRLALDVGLGAGAHLYREVAYVKVGTYYHVCRQVAYKKLCERRY